MLSPLETPNCLSEEVRQIAVLSSSLQSLHVREREFRVRPSTHLFMKVPNQISGMPTTSPSVFDGAVGGFGLQRVRSLQVNNP